MVHVGLREFIARLASGILVTSILRCSVQNGILVMKRYTNHTYMQAVEWLFYCHIIDLSFKFCVQFLNFFYFIGVHMWCVKCLYVYCCPHCRIANRLPIIQWPFVPGTGCMPWRFCPNLCITIVLSMCINVKKKSELFFHEWFLLAYLRMKLLWLFDWRAFITKMWNKDDGIIHMIFVWWF